MLDLPKIIAEYKKFKQSPKSVRTSYTIYKSHDSGQMGWVIDDEFIPIGRVLEFNMEIQIHHPEIIIRARHV